MAPSATGDRAGQASSRAEHALDLVGSDPRAALAEADEVVSSIPAPRTADEARAVVTAQRAAGLALRQLSDPASAVRRLRRAVRIADRQGDILLAAQARMTLGYLLLELGRLKEALRVVEAPGRLTDELAAARLLTIRALVHHRAGRLDEALDDYETALAVLTRHDDDLWESRLLNNRSLLLAARGDAARALEDLDRVRDNDVAHGRTADAADALYNMGYIAGLAGDVPRALDLFDRAAAQWGDRQRAEHAAGRAEVLLKAGLVHEALLEATASVSFLAGRGWSALEAEARLILAQTCLVAGSVEPDEVLKQARDARRLMRGGRRRDWAAIADYVDAKAALSAGRLPTPSTVLRTLAALNDTGAVVHAADLALAHGRTAIAKGRIRSGERVLRDLAAVGGSAAVVDAERLFARSLLAELEGDGRGSSAALERAWRSADTRRSLLGASELLAGAARRGREVAETGARRALAAGSVARAFTWVERERGAVMRHTPARPPDDSELSAAFQQARWAAAEDEAARLAGGEIDRRLAHARADAERRVVELSRHVAGGSRPLAPVSFSEVQRALRGATFVQLVDLDGRIHALVVQEGRGRHLDLAATEAVVAARRALEFELRRSLLTRRGPGDGLAAARRRLGDLLLDPLRGLTSSEELVVSPPASLAAVPWTLVAVDTGLTVAVAPSATSWVRSRRAPRRELSRALLVAGPGLPAADAETSAIAATYPEAELLQGSAATCERVLAAAPGCDVLHIAAHGTLRGDNPLFSSLRLADGPLTAYDLEALSPSPAFVTLTACSSGAGGSAHGDEVLGLAWTLLRGGSHAVVAPILPVPDDATAELAESLHRRLLAGLSASQALASARDHLGEDPRLLAVAGSFVSFG